MHVKESVKARKKHFAVCRAPSLDSFVIRRENRNPGVVSVAFRQRDSVSVIQYHTGLCLNLLSTFNTPLGHLACFYFGTLFVCLLGGACVVEAEVRGQLPEVGPLLLPC